MSSTTSYRTALVEVLKENPDSPAVGFFKTATADPRDLAGASANKVIIKQSNTQIQLLTTIAEKLESIETSLKDIRNKVLSEGSTSGSLPEELLTKLENLMVTRKEKLKLPKGSIYMYESPYDILKQEKDKYGK